MIRFTRFATATSVACLVAMAAAVHAQDTPAAGAAQQSGSAQPAGSAQPGAKATDLDKLFMKSTAAGNLFEIQLGQLAQQKAQDEKVKQFARKMVEDHTKADNELKQLAQSKGVQLPQQLPEMKQEELQIFQSLSGAEFDQAYTSCMKVSHAKGVAAFEEKSKHAKDAELKAWAAKTLPTLKMHKQHVMAMTGDRGDDAQTAGSREQADPGAREKSDPGASGTRSPSESGTGSSSSGTGSRETGSGTSTGGGTTGAGSGRQP